MSDSIKILFTRQEKEQFSESLASLEDALRTCVQVFRNSNRAASATDNDCNVAGEPKSKIDKSLPPPGGEDVVDQRKLVKNLVVIEVRVVFLKLGEIDTLRDRFTADAFLQARWREPLLDNQRYSPNKDSIKLEDFWSPQLLIENSIGDLKENVWLTLTFDDLGKAYIIQKRRMSGTFMEFMELHKFPFDTQDLTISVTSKRDEHEVRFEPDSTMPSGLNVESFVDEQEWRLHRSVKHWARSREEVLSNSKSKHHVFSVATKATRRPEFFLWNIMTVQFLIVSLSFATFAVPVTAPQNRLQLSLVLLLTTVSLKFVVNQSLPVIAYLTYLDKYILTSMAILCCICIWHSVVNVISNVYGLNTASTADRIAMATIIIFFLLLHVAVLIVVALMIKSLATSNDESADAKLMAFEGVRKFDDDDSMDYKAMPKMFREIGNMKVVRAENTSDQVNAQQSLSTLN